MARRVAIGLAIATATLATAFAPTRADADGDPASDYLLGQSVFYPFSPAVSSSLQKTLNAEAVAAAHAHFPIKVALIESRADLGAVPTLFGKPREYATFLDQEISFANTKDLLLVVMPNGYGVAGLTPQATAAVASLHKPADHTSNGLASAAVIAIPRLAAAAGHPASAISGASGTSTGTGTGSGGGGGGATPVGVAALAVGAVLIAGGVVWFRRRHTQVS